MISATEIRRLEQGQIIDVTLIDEHNEVAEHCKPAAWGKTFRVTVDSVEFVFDDHPRIPGKMGGKVPTGIVWGLSSPDAEMPFPLEIPRHTEGVKLGFHDWLVAKIEVVGG